MTTVPLRDGPLEVICAGWGRTGTLSLKMALETLGYRCYHMSDCFKHKGDADVWLKLAEAASQGKTLDFTKPLSGSTAVTDWPAVYFWKQLITAYPEAKVILNTRDADKWYESGKETVWEMSKTIRAVPWYVTLAHKVLNPGYSLAMVDKLVWQGDLQGCFEDSEKTKQLFEQHNKDVVKAVPTDRLLVYEVAQGWQPLCEFLGKPVPSEPFPHANEREHWRQRVAFVRKLNTALTFGLPAVAAAVVGILLAAVQRWLRT